MNKVMLIGNVGKEPDVRYVDQGVAVARFSLATNESGYTLPNGIKVPDRTDWHNIVLWRRLAEVVEKYVHKGDKLYIEGRIRYTTYDDKQGIRHNITEIWAENMEMLTPKSVSTANNAGTATGSSTASSGNDTQSNSGLQSGSAQQNSDQPPF